RKPAIDLDAGSYRLKTSLFEVHSELVKSLAIYHVPWSFAPHQFEASLVQQAVARSPCMVDDQIVLLHTVDAAAPSWELVIVCKFVTLGCIQLKPTDCDLLVLCQLISALQQVLPFLDVGRGGGGVGSVRVGACRNGSHYRRPNGVFGHRSCKDVAVREGQSSAGINGFRRARKAAGRGKVSDPLLCGWNLDRVHILRLILSQFLPRPERERLVFQQGSADGETVLVLLERRDAVLEERPSIQIVVAQELISGTMKRVRSSLGNDIHERARQAAKLDIRVGAEEPELLDGIGIWWRTALVAPNVIVKTAVDKARVRGGPACIHDEGIIVATGNGLSINPRSPGKGHQQAIDVSPVKR